MARVSLRDWIELLLEPGEVIPRREALTALGGVRAPLVAEAVQLALEMEGQGPLATELAETLGRIDDALGAKAALLANDPSVGAFRTQDSPYRPLGLLAAGADSRTYVAVQVALRRIVTLKLLPGRAAMKPEARARFLADGRQLGRALHPHVAGVLDAGELAGQAYVVCEMVDGQSLQQLITGGGAMEWPLAARLVREALSGLTATHRLSVTHGRILPATLQLDREDRMKLTDFAPSGGRDGLLAVARDVADLGLVFHEMLAGAVLPRPIRRPPELLSSVPAPIAVLVQRLIAPEGPGSLSDCAEAIAALEEAVAQAGAGEAFGSLAKPIGTAPRTPPWAEDAGTGVASRTILVVDDEPNILELAKLLLAPFDFAVTTALSPEDALRLIARQTYDVVLTDLNFPGGLSGVDLVTALRAHPEPIPLVAMSASQDTDIWDQVLRAGVAGIVAKPLDTTELVAVIERAVTRHRPDLLLVDDSHLARRVFKRFFENRGFTVTVVPGVQDAIAAIENVVPAVVVSDLHLDDGTGVDVLQHIHDHHPEVRVIIMSAKPDADMVIRAHRLNVFDFVNKSEDPRYLLRSVERVVITHPLASA